MEYSQILTAPLGMQPCEGTADGAQVTGALILDADQDSINYSSGNFGGGSGVQADGYPQSIKGCPYGYGVFDVPPQSGYSGMPYYGYGIYCNSSTLVTVPAGLSPLALSLTSGANPALNAWVSTAGGATWQANASQALLYMDATAGSFLVTMDVPLPGNSSWEARASLFFGTLRLRVAATIAAGVVGVDLPIINYYNPNSDLSQPDSSVLDWWRVTHQLDPTQARFTLPSGDTLSVTGVVFGVLRRVVGVGGDTWLLRVQASGRLRNAFRPAAWQRYNSWCAGVLPGEGSLAATSSVVAGSVSGSYAGSVTSISLATGSSNLAGTCGPQLWWQRLSHMQLMFARATGSATPVSLRAAAGGALRWSAMATVADSSMWSERYNVSLDAMAAQVLPDGRVLGLVNVTLLTGCNWSPNYGVGYLQGMLSADGTTMLASVIMWGDSRYNYEQMLLPASPTNFTSGTSGSGSAVLTAAAAPAGDGSVLSSAPRNVTTQLTSWVMDAGASLVAGSLELTMPSLEYLNGSAPQNLSVRVAAPGGPSVDMQLAFRPADVDQFTYDPLARYATSTSSRRLCTSALFGTALVNSTGRALVFSGGIVCATAVLQLANGTRQPLYNPDAAGMGMSQYNKGYLVPDADPGSQVVVLLTFATRGGLWVSRDVLTRQSSPLCSGNAPASLRVPVSGASYAGLAMNGTLQVQGMALAGGAGASCRLMSTISGNRASNWFSASLQGSWGGASRPNPPEAPDALSAFSAQVVLPEGGPADLLLVLAQPTATSGGVRRGVLSVYQVDLCGYSDGGMRGTPTYGTYVVQESGNSLSAQFDWGVTNVNCLPGPNTQCSSPLQQVVPVTSSGTLALPNNASMAPAAVELGSSGMTRMLACANDGTACRQSLPLTYRALRWEAQPDVGVVTAAFQVQTAAAGVSFFVNTWTPGQQAWAVPNTGADIILQPTNSTYMGGSLWTRVNSSGLPALVNGGDQVWRIPLVVADGSRRVVADLEISCNSYWENGMQGWTAGPSMLARARYCNARMPLTEVNSGGRADIWGGSALLQPTPSGDLSVIIWFGYQNWQGGSSGPGCSGGPECGGSPWWNAPVAPIPSDWCMGTGRLTMGFVSTAGMTNMSVGEALMGSQGLSTYLQADVTSAQLSQRNATLPAANSWSSDGSWQLNGTMLLATTSSNASGALGVDTTAMRVDVFTPFDDLRSWTALVGTFKYWAEYHTPVDARPPMLFGWWSTVVNTTTANGTQQVYVTGAITGLLGPNNTFPHQLSFQGAAVSARGGGDVCNPYNWGRWDAISGPVNVTTAVAGNRTVPTALTFALDAKLGSYFWGTPRLMFTPSPLGGALPGLQSMTNLSFTGVMQLQPTSYGPQGAHRMHFYACMPVTLRGALLLACMLALHHPVHSICSLFRAPCIL